MIIHKRELRMKTKIRHVYGKYDLESGSALCEVFCFPNGESHQELFESGWLPTRDGKWYQSRSSRIKIEPISGNRRRKLKKINISTNGDYKQILERCKHLYPAIILDEVAYTVLFPHEIYYFNDSVFAILLWFDNIPFVSTLIGGRLDKNGVTPMVHYFFLEKLREHSYPYMYISEWYDEFAYKAELPGFEWWDGEKWVIK